MTAPAYSRVASPSALIIWTQNAAIGAVCANLFSTALANLGLAVFLILFVWVCASDHRRQLNTGQFPVGFAWALGAYYLWQFVGLTYTHASVSYGLETIYADRKLLFILPLVLVFTDERSKKRFLAVFLAFLVAGLITSFALKDPFIQEGLRWYPAKLMRSSAQLANENIFRSHATQSMVFALGVFLSLWFAFQKQALVRRWIFSGLALGFMVNLATITPGRSGYLVFLVLVIWCFTLWRGVKGIALGALAALLIGLSAFTFSSSVHDRIMKGMAETQDFLTVPEETSLGRRMVMYQTTFDMIRENPVLGLGTGGFKSSFSAMAAEKYTGWRAKPADDPHSQYLFVLAENGAIGLVSFLLAIGMMLKYCLKGGSTYGKMAAGCVLAWCATSVFSGHFRTFPEGHLIAFIVGILMVNRPSGEPEASPGPTGRAIP